MEARIIARGLLAGALGGVVAFVFARVFLEPVIERAIAYEDTMSEMHGHGGGHGAHEHGVELFSRGIQANVAASKQPGRHRGRAGIASLRALRSRFVLTDVSSPKLYH